MQRGGVEGTLQSPCPRIYTYICRRVGNACLTGHLIGDLFVWVNQAIQSARFWGNSFRDAKSSPAPSATSYRCRRFGKR